MAAVMPVHTLGSYLIFPITWPKPCREVYHLAKENEISIVLEEFEDIKVLQNRR